jgi:hypothetical protein
MPNCLTCSVRVRTPRVPSLTCCSPMSS